LKMKSALKRLVSIGSWASARASISIDCLGENGMKAAKIKEGIVTRVLLAALLALLSAALLYSKPAMATGPSGTQTPPPAAVDTIDTKVAELKARLEAAKADAASKATELSAAKEKSKIAKANYKKAAKKRDATHKNNREVHVRKYYSVIRGEQLLETASNRKVFIKQSADPPVKEDKSVIKATAARQKAKAQLAKKTAKAEAAKKAAKAKAKSAKEAAEAARKAAKVADDELKKALKAKIAADQKAIKLEENLAKVERQAAAKAAKAAKRLKTAGTTTSD
jgi:hypothetical protein